MTDLIGADLGLTSVDAPGIGKNGLVPTTDEVQKSRDFTSDQEVRWCPGCGFRSFGGLRDGNAIQHSLVELGLGHARDEVVELD